MMVNIVHCSLYMCKCLHAVAVCCVVSVYYICTCIVACLCVCVGGGGVIYSIYAHAHKYVCAHVYVDQIDQNPTRENRDLVFIQIYTKYIVHLYRLIITQ